MTPSKLPNSERHRLSVSGKPWELAIAIVDNTRVKVALDAITDFRVELNPRTGRPAEGLSYSDLLVGILACASDGQALHLDKVAKYLHCDLPAEVRQSRGITREWIDAPVPEFDLVTATRRQRRAYNQTVVDARHRREAAIRATERRFESLTDLLGIRDVRRAMNRHRRTLVQNGTATGEALRQEVTQVAVDAYGLVSPAVRARGERLGFDLCNAILQASLDLIPDVLIERLSREKAIGVDGTFVPAFARGRKGTTSLHSRLSGRDSSGSFSTDPEAGWYVRQYDPSKEPQFVGFGYEAHFTVVMSGGTERANVEFPGLVVGFSLGTPSTEPDTHAIRGITHACSYGKSIGWTPSIFAADSLYPDLTDEGFHWPLHHLGLRLLASIKSDRLGKQYEYGGLIIVEGHIYCASMPDRLINASIDREDDKITEEEYHRLIDARLNYRAQIVNDLKVTATPDGYEVSDIRVACPASATTTRQAACERKPSSIKHDPTQPIVNPRPLLPIASVNSRDEHAEMPDACIQRTITLPGAKIARFLQALPYGSAEASRTKSRVRNMNEGKNADAKGGGNEGLGADGRRAVAGRVENAILAVCSVVATNLRLVRTFLENATFVEGRLTRFHGNRPRRPYPKRDKNKSSRTRPAATRKSKRTKSRGQTQRAGP